jgi:hypothetical protein
LVAATLVPEPLLALAVPDEPMPVDDELAAPEVLPLPTSHAQRLRLHARPALVHGVQLQAALPVPPLVLLEEGDRQVQAAVSQSNPELMQGEQSQAELDPPVLLPVPSSQAQLTGLQASPAFVQGEQSQLEVPEPLEVVPVEDAVSRVLVELPPVVLVDAVLVLVELVLVAALLTPCDPLAPWEVEPLVPDEEAVVPETEPLAVVAVPVPPALVPAVVPPPPNWQAPCWHT